MRKIVKRFDEIWARAEERNRVEGQKFIKIYEQRKRHVTMGVYDGLSKKFCYFDTINLIGNFRYNPKDVPAEFEEMAKIVG